MKNSRVTSDDRQVEAIVKLVRIAAGKAARSAVKKLTTSERQRILTQGDVLSDSLGRTICTKMGELCLHNAYLKLISSDEKILIAPTDGKSTISQAKETFAGYIDPDFDNNGINVLSDPTRETPVQVLELIKDGSLTQIFLGFGENLDHFCLTQNQVKSFVQDRSKWLLENGRITFFLFKINYNYFVVCVYCRDGKFRAELRRIPSSDIWHTQYKHRVVVPKF